jgi:hypothetical protein
MKTATVAVQAKEDVMKIYTISELQLLGRAQLLELREIVSRHLMVLSDDATERSEALENLDNIRRVLNGRVRRPTTGRFAPPAP